MMDKDFKCKSQILTNSFRCYKNASIFEYSHTSDCRTHKWSLKTGGGLGKQVNIIALPFETVVVSL